MRLIEQKSGSLIEDVDGYSKSSFRDKLQTLDI